MKATISNNLTNMAPIEIYIPRILGTVHRATVIDAFNRLNIGSVMKLDMHFKVNENSNAYYFAFIKLHLYPTTSAKRMNASIEDGNVAKLVYDEEAMQYWEIKKHVPKDIRSTSSDFTEKKLPKSHTSHVNAKAATAIRPINHDPKPTQSMLSKPWPRAPVQNKPAPTTSAVSNNEKKPFVNKVPLIPAEYSIWKGFPAILPNTSADVAEAPATMVHSAYDDSDDFNEMSSIIDKIRMVQNNSMV